MGAMTRDGDGRKAPPFAVFAAGDIVLTPLNQRARLTQLREDQRWDAWYIDDQDNKIAHASVVLNPKLMQHE